MKNNTPKQMKNKNGSDYNLLTANVGHSEVAKNIIEGILIDCSFAETTVDALAMLFEAFASKETLVEVQDYADDLQRALFVHSKDFDEAVKVYIETVKQGKDYESANTVIAS